MVDSREEGWVIGSSMPRSAFPRRLPVTFVQGGPRVEADEKTLQAAPHTEPGNNLP